MTHPAPWCLPANNSNLVKSNRVVAVLLPLMPDMFVFFPQNFTPFQYQDPSGRLMMLPSDIVLIEDSKFKK